MSKVDGSGVEVAENGFDVGSDNVPELNVERRAQTIRPGAGELVHIQESVFYFREGERGREVRGEVVRVMVEIREGKIPATRRCSAEKQLIVVSKRGRFIVMGGDVDAVH